MKKLRICIIDLIHNKHSQSLYRHAMFSNYASIMPQVIGVWCREEGHDVHYSIYTGTEKLKDLLVDKPDLVFISSFTYTAQLAYALSSYFRSQGVVTILGGPHARCYPGDACRFFDYVMGLTDKQLVKDLLHYFEPGKHQGTCLSAVSQPKSLPGIRERWHFIEKIQQHFSVVKIVPMIGSFGCPYHCDFCIDSEIPYQTLDKEAMKEDFRFLINKMNHPIVGWYDPNFGINFNFFLDSIESVVPPGSMSFIAECSLSVLSEPNVKRLQKNGFKMIMPGIESWFDYGKKLKTGSSIGMGKVREVAEHVNMVQRYIPQVNTNFMYGFDSDFGDDPFTFTKRFIDLAPAAYPSYALLSAYGGSALGNLKYEIENRIIPFPFHMLMPVQITNVIPKNYTWEDLYFRFIDLLEYSFSAKAMYRRFAANKATAPRWITLLLSLTIGGSGKIKDLSSMLKKLNSEPDFRSFVTRESDRVPAFIIETVKKDLGPLWQWLPDKSLWYDTHILSKQDLVQAMH